MWNRPPATLPHRPKARVTVVLYADLLGGRGTNPVRTVPSVAAKAAAGSTTERDDRKKERIRCFLLSIPVVSYRFLPQDESAVIHSLGSDVQKKYAPKILDIPHHVLIVYGNSFCSGSIISSLTVLTAASCFWRYTGQEVAVKAGTNVISEDANVYVVQAIKIHEYYKHRSDMDNDIALLLLKNHVAFSDALKKVILVEPETAVRVNAPLIVSGWSTVKLSPKFGNVLLWSEMIVVDRHDCIDTYKGFISPSNFCARFNLERRLYDNGCPAVYDGFLVGVMSFGAMKADEPHIAVFTNVSYFYRWIHLNTKIFHQIRCDQLVDSAEELENYEYEE